MENQVSINITLCNRTYRIKVNAADEGKIRERVKAIQEKINVFKKQYPSQDEHDYMAMTLIDHLTSDKATSKDETNNIQQIQQQLKSIQQLLDS
jgi:cell division protein ZapA